MNTANLNYERIENDLSVAYCLYGSLVSDELAMIATVPDIERAQRALVFAMLSPRCPFHRNVAATPAILDAIRNNYSRFILERILRQFGIGLAPSKSLLLYFAGDHIRNMRQPPDRDLLLALRGVGPKVSAMAIALYDASAPVFTLDTHMVQGITGTDTDKLRGKHYFQLERYMLDMVSDVLPGVEPFTAQWCLWNHYGFQRHVSHLAIFGLTAWCPQCGLIAIGDDTDICAACWQEQQDNVAREEDSQSPWPDIAWYDTSAELE